MECVQTQTAVAFFRVAGMKEMMTHACIEIPQDPEIEVGHVIEGVLKYVHCMVLFSIHA
jgi:hypothetical protein